MTTTENAIIKPLADDDIIRDDTLEKAILAYIKLVRRSISNFEETQTAVAYVSAWFAVEHLGYFPSALLRDICNASKLGPAVFIEFLIRVRAILLDRRAGEVVIKDPDGTPSPDGPYTVPREFGTSCEACIRHEVPCIRVLSSSQCFSCFLRKLSHCIKSDHIGSHDTCEDAQQEELAVPANAETFTGDTAIQPVPRETTNLPPARPLSSADASDGERLLTAKKPFMEASYVPEPPEVDTPSSMPDDEDQDYIPSTTFTRTDYDEKRSEIMKAVWAEKRRIAKETGQPAKDVRLPKGFAHGVGERLGLETRSRKRGRRSLHSNTREGQGRAPPPQLARRSTAFPKPSSDTGVPRPTTPENSAVAGPSTSAEKSKLPSPPPSKRRRTSPDSPPSVPQPLAEAKGPPESQSAAGPQRKFDPAFLRVAIRKVAEKISSYNEKAPCTDEDLFWLITDLKTRLDELIGLSAQITADQQIANDSGLADLEELMLEKEREIVAYVRENQCSDMRLRVMILDLSKRLEMQ